MYDDDETPEEFTDALSEWSRAQRALREPLRPHMLTNAWIAGLIAGTRLKAEHGKKWTATAKGGYGRALPFVIEMPCPFGHRTEDRTDYARVRLIIEDDGWPSLDPASPCPKCSGPDLEQWALTCPRCEAGEDHEQHYPEHLPLDVLTMYDGIDYDDSAGGFDASPVAWVMREFVRLGRQAAARWWIEHTDEAAQSIPRGIQDRQKYVSDRLEWARHILGAQPTKSAAEKSSTASQFDTPEKVAKWLEGLKTDDGGTAVPANASTRAAWEVVKDFPKDMRPSKNQCDYAQAIRNGSRATGA